ncbi:ATP-binding cassette domain-containing protein [Azoarcus indigens]|uniref:Branched-chain amino acid transport system ATP-binding protein n=1 Tax=Azoarcus indigens TaxID=29545 RepID=A0A4R6DMF3_9RHOO|nr:ABC transporter ATP-binding protein [Azoarcus indigens]NMG65750.1 ATP-binding cassette domain-containing protein [Azoarcus indigens]TDN46106.1 branched-chain amino acid transport system ATP-binding protein [Azoarcus indigens]
MSATATLGNAGALAGSAAGSTASDYALEVRGLSKSFGGLEVIGDLSFAAPRGKATALIGPNGAGKTTVFNLVSGVYTPTAGTVLVNGQDITGVPSRRRIHAGVARSFQNIRLMQHLTVIENLLIGQHVRAQGLGALFSPFRLMPKHRWWKEAQQALDECGLGAYAQQTVGALAYGIRKRIDLVRATLAGPSLLLLDEPAAGLNPTETQDLLAHLRLLASRGTSLLVVEHDMPFVGEICEHVVVLNFGRKIAEGTLDEVRQVPQVREAYLGSEEE